MHSISLTVLIPTHGRPNLLGRTLASVAMCVLPDGYAECLVVENGVPAGAEGVVARAAAVYPGARFRYIHVEQANKSMALNTALAEIDDDMLCVFFDDDIRLDTQTLTAYAEAATSRSYFGGPVSCDYEAQPPAWFLPLLPHSAKGYELSNRGVMTDEYLGFNWAAFAGDVKAVLFNPDVGPGSPTGARGQETEIQRHLRARGVRPVDVPGARVWHYVPRERCSVSWLLRRSSDMGRTKGILSGGDRGRAALAVLKATLSAAKQAAALDRRGAVAASRNAAYNMGWFRSLYMHAEPEERTILPAERAEPRLKRNATSSWSRIVGVRSRSVAQLARTWHRYSGDRSWGLQAWVRTARLMVAPRKTILCYPMRPSQYAVLYKLCVLGGYWVTTNPERRCDAVFRWDNTTRSTVGRFRHDEAAINRYCTDISKEHISHVFEDVFGYSLLVDPTTYVGRAVKKSDENATHDGEVIECPISTGDVAPGYVYQKAIDNRRAGSEGFYEYRVPILGTSLPVVYIKYRPATAQFKAFDGAEVVSPESVLSETERTRLVAFAEALQMEYGELDVLRDREDGRIYVVDANNTPSGPERGFRPEQSVEALRRLQPAFEALLADSRRRLMRHGVDDGPPDPASRSVRPSRPATLKVL